jgi:hypothetical protein
MTPQLDPASIAGIARSNALLAVDLGASNVKMAWFHEGRLTDSSEQHSEFPAAVTCRGGDLVVGKDALEFAGRDPASTLLHVREWLGLVPSVRLAGTEFTIKQAVTALYRAAALTAIGTTEGPATVLVHPAPWPRRRIELLSSCARAAGLEVIDSLPDAIAVARNETLKGDVLVIDVGSALTASVVDLRSSPPQILWSRSNVGAGGEAIAQAIQVVSEVPADRAREFARGAEPVQGEQPLSWGAVEAQAQPSVEEAGDLIGSVLRRANRAAKSISRIYVTGGSSGAPFVRTAVEAQFDVNRIIWLKGASASAARGALPRPTSSVDNLWGLTRPPEAVVEEAHDHPPPADDDLDAEESTDERMEDSFTHNEWPLSDFGEPTVEVHRGSDTESETQTEETPRRHRRWLIALVILVAGIALVGLLAVLS